MSKHASELPAQPEEKKLFTEEDVQKIVAAERKRQFIMDESRIHGNAFFAESLDHISTLARDPFWKKVYQFGTMFKNQFEINSGQAAPVAPQQSEAPVAKEKPAKKQPVADAPAADTSDEASGAEEQT